MPKILKGKVSKSLDNLAKLQLPTVKSEPLKRPEQLKFLVVAPPGWGKTELCMSNPDAVLLACEEGHKYTSGYKIIIDAWDDVEPWVDKDGIQHMSFVDAVALLARDTKRFSTIIVDTVDMLVKMLLDYELGNRKVDHATDLGDYGKGWDLAQNTPFRRQFNKLIKTGRGIAATTHEQAENKNFKRGTFAKKETTLPAGIYKQIFGQFDVIFHGWFGKHRKGQNTRDRIIQTEGSSDLLAKNRGGHFPPAFIVPRDIEARWKQIVGFFENPTTKSRAFKEFEDKGYELE